MKTFRVLLLCLLALGIPLQGWASVSQAFCRMTQTAAVGPSATHETTVSHDTSTPHDPLAFNEPCDHTGHMAHAQAGPDVQVHAHAHAPAPGHDPAQDSASHGCSHCAQCAAAHAMGTFPVRASHWPQTLAVWVGAVPQLNGRTFNAAPERPPRTQTA